MWEGSKVEQSFGGGGGGGGNLCGFCVFFFSLLNFLFGGRKEESGLG